MQLRYQFRIEPTPAQRLMLARTFGCCRTVYNDALARRKADFEAGRPALSRSELQRAIITDAKATPERAWLSETSTDTQIQAHNDLLLAFSNFFQSVTGKRKGRKVGYPKFRSRHDNRQSARFTKNGFKLRDNGRLFLAKIGEVKVRWSRPLPSDPSSVTIIRDASGRFHASFVVETDETADEHRFPATDSEVGIDVGVKTFAVLSDGTLITAPKFLARAERKLRKAQQALSRKQKGSKNRAKQVQTVARVHARVADARKDFHHQTSTRIIRENQTVILEDLNVAGMLKNKRLAKSISNAGWASFASMLEYKAARYGRTMHRINRFTPTTQQCSTCGERSGPTGATQLHVRSWDCACGARHDRDLNAAINILAAGRAERLNASGEQVRPRRARTTPAPFNERGTHPSDPTSAKPAPRGAVRIPAL